MGHKSASRTRSPFVASFRIADNTATDTSSSSSASLPQREHDYCFDGISLRREFEFVS